LNSVKIKRGRAGDRGKRPYHHGDLRRQLLAVAEEIILERGVDGFTLREAARRAGVSPAAPAYHFGDVRGLLTQVALSGFQELDRVLEEADAAGGDSAARRLRLQGQAYVRFALEHPARFKLMFRQDKLDETNQEFLTVAGHSYGVLERAIRAAAGVAAAAPLPTEAYGLLAATWSIVHGFAHLALDGQLRAGPCVRGSDAIVDGLLAQVLEQLPWIATSPEAGMRNSVVHGKVPSEGPAGES
jgi:AcrR family transcriptional regulator